ncbi:hypothetical protein C4D60_Mb07t08500 [Musa balbisiana]|uniref:Matrin-type domain-containing protein n=1 Tax=Musa balbisiana TaxID=52838 RepID=A0A4S8JDV2_MUSBA|nr:hypothetical protein C4D60_Mb07t08500 [Musa balbisiana]
MTESWVSQGNKCCDFCKIYIANNPLSIRTHELGQRHKDNVAKRLATIKQKRATRMIWLLSRELILLMDCNLIRKLQMKPSVQLQLEMDRVGPYLVKLDGQIRWSFRVGYLNTFEPHEGC